MKYLYILLFLFLLSACSKDEIDWSVHTSTATLNDTVEWSSTKNWFNNKRSDGHIFIALEKRNDWGALRELIRFKNFPLTMGKTPLFSFRTRFSETRHEPTAYFDTLIADGDAGTEFYNLYHQEGFENFIRIDYISPDTTVIEGFYQLYFVISEDSPSKFDETRPDTLVFTNGAFTARQREL